MRCAEKRDVPALLALLDSLDDDAREAARRWYRGARTSIRKTTDSSPFRGFDKMVAAAKVEAVLCVALAPPASAAKWLRWEWLTQGAQVVTPLVVRRGRDWCADFVAAADKLPARGDRWGLSRSVYDVLREAVDAHDLPTPVGAPFVEGWMMAVTPPVSWAQGKPSVPDQQQVLSRLRADPRLDDLVAPVLAHSQLGQHAHLAAGIAILAVEGTLARDKVVDLCLAGLDSPGRPGTQKALAGALVSVGLRSDELPGGLPRLQQLLATCHGSVTSRLLPLALEQVATADELVELTTTIAARPEKKQRTDLLRAVTNGLIADRVRADGRRAALEILADNPDAAVAGKAARALEALGGSAFPATPTSLAGTGLWDLSLPAPEPPTSFAEPGVFDDDTVAIIRKAAATTTAWQILPPWYEPLALSLVIRWSYRDGAKSARRAIGTVEVGQYHATLFGPALALWLRKRLPPPLAPISVPRQPHEQSPSVLAERHLRESLFRAGRIPFLLSSPTHTDASLDFGVLVERLRHSAGVGFGPLDLLVAILRLGPVDPARAAELDGLAPVLPDPTVGPTRIRDAATYLRNAVAAGRLLPPPVTRDRMEEEGWVPDTAPDPSHRYARTHEGEPPDAFWEAMLPVPLADFGASVRELGSDSYLAGHDQVVLRSVVPWQADLRLRATGLWHPYSDWWNGTQHLDSRGAIGVPCHDLLLAGYAADRPDSRRETVDLTLAWIGAGRYAVDPGLAASWARLKLGRLNLARCAAAWEQVFLAGGMRAAWPVALGSAAFAADLPRKPAGLADLLRMLTQYVGEVPAAGRDLPAPLVDLAQAKGSTKSHAEARLLAAAARSGSA